MAPTRTRKLCASAVLGLALFAASTPAHADDTPLGADANAAAIAADVDTATAAAVAQASAVVGEVSAEASVPTVQAPASGSTSGASGGISGATPPQATQGAAPTIEGAVGSAVEGATTAATDVVAAAKQVVSLPQAPAAGAATPPAATTAPAAGATDSGGQYQQNDGRYQPGNSTPISSEIGRSSSTDSSAEPPSVSPPNSGRIPLPKCLEDLPDPVMQTACEDALSQLPDVRTVLGAPASDHSSARTHPRRTPRTSPASHPSSPSPAVPSHLQTESVPHAAAVVVAVPTAKHMAPANPRHERPVAGRTHRVRPVPRRRNLEPSLVTLRPDTPAREAARNEPTAASDRLPLFLVAVFLGLTTLALALGSLGLRRGVALTAIATRVRSKGLSSGAKLRAGAREEAPPAIRYRE